MSAATDRVVASLPGMTVALPYHFDSSRVWRMILTGALAIGAVILAGALYGFLVRGDVTLALPLVLCGALLAYFSRISRISAEELKAKLDGGGGDDDRHRRPTREPPLPQTAGQSVLDQMTGLVVGNSVLGPRCGRLAEIRDRMVRPGTTTTASTRLRRFRFLRRGAEGHRQLATARVEHRIVTAPLNPGGRCAPFALRYCLPRHVGITSPSSMRQPDGRRSTLLAFQIMATRVAFG
jgi:hypothetical protein